METSKTKNCHHCVGAIMAHVKKYHHYGQLLFVLFVMTGMSQSHAASPLRDFSCECNEMVNQAPVNDAQNEYAQKIIALAKANFRTVSQKLLNNTTGFKLKYVETIEKYYNNFVGDPSYYEGSVRHYRGDGISVYLNDNKNECDVYIDNQAGFKKFVSQIKRMGYKYDAKESGEGARGEAWVYTKGKNSICIWCGGGAFPGYSVSIY